jgi:predicted P-loop ATPase
MKKADIDKVKAFISRQDDKYRASFGRRVTPHPRQCIFFGTTNSQNGYLRDITGNRRFWTVRTPGNGRWKAWDLTREDIEQIWAEVLVLIDQGEKLYLDSNMERYSTAEQAFAMEQDDREGLVSDYLNLLLPDN